MIRPFRYSDVPSINKWLKKHGHPQVTFADLPMIGYIIPGVAAAFLRQCEGGYAIMDSMCSNPHVSSQTRNSAMEQLFNRILTVPGFKTILGFTVDGGALERAKRQGFQSLPHTVLALYKE